MSPDLRAGLIGIWALLMPAVAVALHGVYERAVKAYSDWEMAQLTADLTPFYSVLGIGVFFLLYTLVASRCVLRVYYDKNREIFTAVTMRPLYPLKGNQMVIKPGQNVQVAPLLVESIDRFYTAKLHGKKVLMLPTDFTDVGYFNKLFGFEEQDAIIKMSGHKSLHDYFQEKRK